MPRCPMQELQVSLIHYTHSAKERDRESDDKETAKGIYEPSRFF